MSNPPDTAIFAQSEFIGDKCNPLIDNCEPPETEEEYLIYPLLSIWAVEIMQMVMPFLSLFMQIASQKKGDWD